ncbi:DMT family transporter [Sulfitobacter albidus]|uniref:DMT family transporter n=1 Tax=Sulfitobacter albidus TaxID=2829501 RepID=A0A975JFA2_9RHOB|nr:DMT family transporter [Sulfitobacter albidus]QUJ76935.1 DMT family transporter [Sulfitobacter albidus]
MFTAPPQNNLHAAFLITLATAFIAATTLMAKALGTDTLGPALPALQISHGRFLFAFLTLGAVAAVLRPSFGPVHWRLHLGRTSLGWGGVTLMFASVAFIPLSDATAISFLNPVFAMMLAIPLLGERVGAIRWSAAALALLGAVILLRPTAASFQPAALLALGAALLMGLELIFIKKLSGREKPFQILLVNNMIGLTIASAAVVPVWQVPTGGQWLCLAALGVCMALAQTCFVNAMARADASFVAPFSYSTLIFAAILDALFFNVLPDAVSVVGAATILAGALALALREARLRKHPRPPDARA